MSQAKKRFQVVLPNEVTPVPCPCGMADRAFTDDPDQVASMHVVQISKDSKTHYHKKMTEIYFVLEGGGYIELDGEQIEVQAGSRILIKPGCRHRAIGDMKIINVAVPAFDSADEYFDET